MRDGKEVAEKLADILHRWQYVVLMARRGNQTGHWTYGQHWGHYTHCPVSTTDCRATLYKLSISLSEYDRLTPTLHHCNEGRDSPGLTPRQLKYFWENINTRPPSDPMLVFTVLSSEWLVNIWRRIINNPSHLACLFRSYWVQHF